MNLIAMIIGYIVIALFSAFIGLIVWWWIEYFVSLLLDKVKFLQTKYDVYFISYYKSKHVDPHITLNGEDVYLRFPEQDHWRFRYFVVNTNWNKSKRRDAFYSFVNDPTIIDPENHMISKIYVFRERVRKTQDKLMSDLEEELYYHYIEDENELDETLLDLYEAKIIKDNNIEGGYDYRHSYVTREWFKNGSHGERVLLNKEESNDAEKKL